MNFLFLVCLAILCFGCNPTTSTQKVYRTTSDGEGLTWNFGDDGIAYFFHWKKADIVAKYSNWHEERWSLLVPSDFESILKHSDGVSGPGLYVSDNPYDSMSYGDVLLIVRFFAPDKQTLSFPAPFAEMLGSKACKSSEIKCGGEDSWFILQKYPKNGIVVHVRIATPNIVQEVLKDNLSSYPAEQGKVGHLPLFRKFLSELPTLRTTLPNLSKESFKFMQSLIHEKIKYLTKTAPNNAGAMGYLKGSASTLMAVMLDLLRIAYFPIEQPSAEKYYANLNQQFKNAKWKLDSQSLRGEALMDVLTNKPDVTKTLPENQAWLKNKPENQSLTRIEIMCQDLVEALMVAGGTEVAKAFRPACKPGFKLE